MTATFTKLKSGEWGVRVEDCPDIAAGDVVKVTKRDGSTEVEQIERVLFRSGNAAICAISRKAAHTPSRVAAKPQPNKVRDTYRRKYGWDGVVGSPSYYSSGLYDEES